MADDDCHAPQEVPMPASLIRSRAMITHAHDRHRWNEVTDGAVLQQYGVITGIGTYEELAGVITFAIELAIREFGTNLSGMAGFWGAEHPNLSVR
jgi:hypothetical protein